ncbi:MAG TPA: adenylate/guanylate cyclase domain-containing protein, partial [Sporichthya sp.]|nr:adenylate/guanylate cyclase domain-containing protein [Sporichthya sp.]
PHSRDFSAEAECKQVTVVFADVAGSMQLAEQFDADEWTQIIAGWFTACADAIRGYGGTVDKFTGDGLMALFGAPVAQEDHAARAAHAALAIIGVTRDYGAKVRAQHHIDLHVRVGLNSGDVVAGDVGDSGFTAVGHSVGLAQRMEALADLDTVRLSEHTTRLLGVGFTLRHLGALTVKGSTEPVHTYALDAVPTITRRRAGTARMVGRTAEWETLLAGLEAAERGQAQVIGIVGEAGAGKSRLTDEIARHAVERGIRVRRTAGASHATTIPLLAIRALFADFFGIEDSDSDIEVRTKAGERVLVLDPDLADELPLVFDFLEVPDPQRPAPALGPDARRRRVLEVIRRLTRRRSEVTTMLLVLEDLHWFDEHSVRFLEEWLPSFPGTRTLIVTNFRPEFRPPWAGRSYYRQIPLTALDTSAVREMLGDLVGRHSSLQAALAGLTDRAGGNPFFVEEIVREWVEDGTLTGAPGSYLLARPVEAVRVPYSVRAVLAGRIDRLDPQSKAVLQAAAVMGRTFSLAVLAAVTLLERDALTATVADLCAAELLQQNDDQEYRFWHPLTQEVAYASLLGATRRRHHRSTAAALLATATGRDDELAALVASHYEAAEEHLESARWQVRAANRAARTDVRDAVRRLRVAIAHADLAPPDPDAASVGVRARTLLLRVGSRAGIDAAEAEAQAVEARRAAEALGDPVLLAHLAMATAISRHFTGHHATAHAAFEDARRHAGISGDPDLQAWTFGVGAAAHTTTGPLDEGLELLAHARKLHAAQPSTAIPRAGSGAELVLPTRADIDDTMHMLSAHISLHAGLLQAARTDLLIAREAYRLRPISDWLVWTLTLHPTLADYSGLDTDADQARDLLDEAHQAADESGSTMATVRVHHATGLLALLDGRPAHAETEFTRGLALARAQRAGLVDEASLLVQLTRTHLAQGDLDRAGAVGAEAVATAHRQGARVVECAAHLVRARLLRSSVRDERDLAAAHAAIADAAALASAVGAGTLTAFLAEETARLEGRDFAGVAAGYDAIGATGHAGRIRAELTAV